MNDKDLREILEKHNKWIMNEEGGERADLYEATLCGADLREADLRGANLWGANLRRTDLYGVDLRGVDLREADLYEATLCGADLREADLYGAELRGANLYEAGGLPEYIMPIHCPEKGAFIGFKKAKLRDLKVIVELRITAEAKRNSATTNKCRCSEAEVISITSLDGKKMYDEAVSNYDENFVYKLGEVVKVDNFDENRWNECSAGIHFFVTRNEAVNY